MSQRPSDPYAETLGLIDDLLIALGLAPLVRQAVMALVKDNADPAHIRAHVLSSERPPQTVGEIARQFHKLSLARNDSIGAVVTRDDRWNMLLDLLAAWEEGRPISVSSLAIGAASPSTTALRHIEGLARSGLVERSGDPNDGRRTWITLTPDARARMTDMVRSFTIPRPLPLIVRPD